MHDDITHTFSELIRTGARKQETLLHPVELVISSQIHQPACLLVKQFTIRQTNSQQAT